MPAPRRVRMLAIIVCIVLVFLLYQRSGAVEEAVEQIQVGGGAVLRPQEDEAKPDAPAPPPPINPLLPDVKPEAPKPAAAATEQRIAGLPGPGLDSTPETTTTTTTTTTSSPLALPLLPPTATKASRPETRPEQDVDRFVYELPDEEFVNIDELYPSPTPQHWSKQPEKYPITSTIQLPQGTPKSIPRIQYAGTGAADEEKLAAVKMAAKHAWKGYRDYGWGFDEVTPVTGHGKASFGNWGATLVDSLDTLWIMGMKDEFDDAVNQTSHIDFTTSSRNDIPLFEVTIRYLGGLLAGYDVSGKTYKVLLDKAVQLAEILYSAFDTPNRMPETFYQWKPAFASNSHRSGSRVVLAELGTLSLEFTRLAQLTGEPKYYDAIARITDAFELWQNRTRLPGMWPTKVDASGCNKTVNQMSPSRTHRPHQMPLPGGDTYMITSEPVQVDLETMAKAEKKLADSKTSETVKNDKDTEINAEKKLADLKDPHAVADAALEAMNNHVHNPRPDPIKGSDLRFESEHAPEDPSVNKKRQLDVTTETETQFAPSSLDKPTSQHSYDTGISGAESIWTQEEDVCVPQGLASPSFYASETYTLGGESDSVYEYFPKEYVLLGGQVDQYRTMYLDSMQPVIDKLLYRPMTPEGFDILISGDLHVTINASSDELMEIQIAKGEHLTCFAGGMFAMGAKLFQRPEHLEIARKLTDGCIWTYNATASGIMPESFIASACESKTECKWNQTKYWHELDPYMEYREQQRLTFWETYPDYKPPAETVTKESPLSRPPRPQTLPVHALPKGLVYPDEDELSGSVTSNRKRQLDQDEFERPSPRPASAPALPSYPPKFDDDYEDDVYHYTPPAYTPTPPPTHKEFVEQKIADERIPPGIIRMNSKQYILRPEAIESVFYMYRITGEQYWRDMGWKMFQNVERATRTQYGHSALDDVTKAVPEHLDGMESFWLAETLKYYYLLFDEPDRWSLDDWVLNTEAHFFETPRRK